MTIVQTVNFTLKAIRWLLKSVLLDRMLPTSLHHHHHCVLRHPLLSTTRAPPLETTRWSARGWLFQPSVTKNSSLLRAKRFCTPFLISIDIYTHLYIPCRRLLPERDCRSIAALQFVNQGNNREHTLSGYNSSAFDDFIAPTKHLT